MSVEKISVPEAINPRERPTAPTGSGGVAAFGRVGLAKSVSAA
jgi:hypothetical protein